MVRRSFSGKLEFEDDEPVDLDCGCVAAAGENYNIFTIKYVKNGENKILQRLCCEDKECENQMLLDILQEISEVSITESYVKNAHDEYCGYLDYIEEYGRD